MKRLLVFKNAEVSSLGWFAQAIEEAPVDIELLMVEVQHREQSVEVTDVDAVVILGGIPMAAFDPDLYAHPHQRAREAIEAGVPLLGICAGHQFLARSADGVVEVAAEPELGFASPDGEPFELRLNGAGQDDPLFVGVPSTLKAFQLHHKEVLPSPNYQVLAESEDGRVGAIKVGPVAYGIQPHLEITSQILDTWHGAFEDLSAQDLGQLQQQLEDRRQTSEAAVQIMRNFLRLAGIVD